MGRKVFIVRLISNLYAGYIETIHRLNESTESPKNGKGENEGEKIGHEREKAVLLPRGGYGSHRDFIRTSGASSPCLADDVGGREKGCPEKISLVATIIASVTANMHLLTCNLGGLDGEAHTALKGSLGFPFDRGSGVSFL
jgi:hypothetical protein